MQKIGLVVLATMVLMGCSRSLTISDLNDKELAQITQMRQQVLETRPSGKAFMWSTETLSGVMTVVKTTEQNNGFCRYLSETLNSEKRPLSINSLWCRRDQGGWVLQD